MDIHIGARMIVEFSNKERMNCRFIGLDKDEFLVLKVPMVPGIRERMGEGAFHQFRYLKDGKIIGFSAEVLRYQASPASLAFISYPTEFTEYNLRHQGRVECRFPTELAVNETMCSGFIVDISSGGCKFLFEGNVGLKIEDKSSVAGTFVTMEGDKKYSFSGTVTALQSVGDERGLGIKFESDVDLPEGVQDRLKQIEDMRELEKPTS